MGVTIVNDLGKDTWRKYVDENPLGNIFHTPEMFEVFARTRGHCPKIWAAMGENQEILALFPAVQISLNEGILQSITTRTIAYGSLLYSPGSAGREALEAVLQCYVRKAQGGGVFTELRNLSDLSAVQPILNKAGFCQEGHQDFLIDLDKPVDEVMRVISKSGRKSIRRSIEKGVEVEEIQDRSCIPVFYQMLQNTYQRARIPLVDISFFYAVFDILVPKGMAKMLLAKVDGKYIAASLEMPYKQIIYSMYSGYDWDWRPYFPNDRLVWHILEWGAKNGYTTYDFGGAGKPGEVYGVREFKAKFGGKLVQYDRNTYVHTPLILLFSRVGYQMYRQLMRILPTRSIDN